jgi:hypothetical protein
MSVGTAGVSAWVGSPFARESQQDGHSGVAMHGGRQAVHPEPKLVVDRCFEVQSWDFDPMLVEVEACQARLCQAVSEVAQAVDLRLCPDVCGSGQTSPRPSLLEPEQAGGSLPPAQVNFPPSR